jgi:Nucleoside-diphosphate-sugar epimerases
MTAKTDILKPADAVVVCGGGGFLGGHFVQTLRSRGFKNVRAVDIKPLSQWYQTFPDVENLTLDLSDKQSCLTAVQGMKHVINLAADMGGMGFIAVHKAACMLNVLINTHLLQATQTHSVESFFFASSACVYSQTLQGSEEIVKLREQDAWPALPEEGYGLEKLFSEQMCQFFRQDYGVPTTVARFHNVYGPCGAYNDGREKAPAALSRKVAAAKISGNHEIEIWGDGEQRRSFLHVDDLVRGTIMLINSGFPEPLNIGSEDSITVNGLVDLLEDIAGIKCKRKYVGDRPQGVRTRCSDNENVSRVLGWQPSVTLKDGMQETYEWIYQRLLADSKQPVASKTFK